MPRFSVVINLPGYLPNEDPVEFDTRADAARYGAEIIGERADRVQVTRGDLDRWADALGAGETLRYRDELDGNVYAVEIHEIADDSEVAA